MRFDFHGRIDCYKNRVIEDNVKEGERNQSWIICKFSESIISENQYDVGCLFWPDGFVTDLSIRFLAVLLENLYFCVRPKNVK